MRREAEKGGRGERDGLVLEVFGDKVDRAAKVTTSHASRVNLLGDMFSHECVKRCRSATLTVSVRDLVHSEEAKNAYRRRRPGPSMIRPRLIIYGRASASQDAPTPRQPEDPALPAH